MIDKGCSLDIIDLHDLEIARFDPHPTKAFDEFFLRRHLKLRIEQSLIADGSIGAILDAGTAGAAKAVSRIGQDMIAQRIEFFDDAIIQQAGHFLEIVFAIEVGPSQITHKQAIAGKDHIGLIAIGFIDGIGQMTQGVTRGMECFDL